jgi:peptidoglycan/xylan/chitin deacetylase (PgdA/CDA1 family)
VILRSKWTLALASVALLCAVALGLFIRHKLREPVVPAVVTRSTDAHRMVSKSLSARIDRFFHERGPADRSKSPRLIALTFDDGPYPVETPLLLDELADLHVPATFFLIGDDADQFPGLARRIAAAGDEIANHTQTHPARFDRLSEPDVTRELSEGAATLGRYASDPSITHMMRPPHGRFTLHTVIAAQRAGYDVVLWNDDPGDWRSITADAIVDHMRTYATAPDIVLLHSGRLSTIEALPQIVAHFRAAGFTFVTAGQLLAHTPAETIIHPEKLRV